MLPWLTWMKEPLHFMHYTVCVFYCCCWRRFMFINASNINTLHWFSKWANILKLIIVRAQKNVWPTVSIICVFKIKFIKAYFCSPMAINIFVVFKEVLHWSLSDLEKHCSLGHWCSTGQFFPPGDIWKYLETLLVVIPRFRRYCCHK